MTIIQGDVIKTTWYQRNRLKQQENNRKAYSENPEKFRKYKRDYYHKRKTEDAYVIYRLWKHAKQRALKKNLPFTISREDIKIPEYCPILGIKLEREGNIRNSPSIDRKIPALGYTPENIWVISTQANRMKWDSSKEELELFAKGILKLLETGGIL